MKTKTICLIPARGGSKRIKNKNILNFLGKSFYKELLKMQKKVKYLTKFMSQLIQ